MRWRNTLEWTASIALAALWFAAGIWKLSDVTATQVRMTQALVPKSLSLVAALSLGTLETFAGLLLLIPAWRRWGAWISGVLLSVFMLYIGYHYRALTGVECNCFPWLKRAVGPMFFLEDGALIALAVVAGLWTQPSRGLRRALASFAAIVILAGSLFAVDRVRGAGAAGPASITADGSELSLREGRVFLYFFNPLCIHCFQAAQAMSKLNWQATFVGLPTQDFDQGQDFFQSAGVKGVRLSPDVEKLRQSFPFKDVPYAVALENGRLRERVVFFDEPQLGEKLREIGFAR